MSWKASCLGKLPARVLSGQASWSSTASPISVQARQTSGRVKVATCDTLLRTEFIGAGVKTQSLQSLPMELEGRGFMGACGFEFRRRRVLHSARKEREADGASAKAHQAGTHRVKCAGSGMCRLCARQLGMTPREQHLFLRKSPPCGSMSWTEACFTASLYCKHVHCHNQCWLQNAYFQTISGN